jgi:hypothetical protein
MICIVPEVSVITNEQLSLMFNNPKIIKVKQIEILSTQKLYELLLNYKGKSHVIIFDYFLSVGDTSEISNIDIQKFSKDILFREKYNNKDLYLTIKALYHDRKDIHQFSSCYDVTIFNSGNIDEDNWLHCIIPPEQKTPFEFPFKQMEPRDILRYHSCLFNIQNVIQTKKCLLYRIFSKPKLTKKSTIPKKTRKYDGPVITFKNSQYYLEYMKDSQILYTMEDDTCDDMCDDMCDTYMTYMNNDYAEYIDDDIYVT